MHVGPHCVGSPCSLPQRKSDAFFPVTCRVKKKHRHTNKRNDTPWKYNIAEQEERKIESAWHAIISCSDDPGSGLSTALTLTVNMDTATSLCRYAYGHIVRLHIPKRSTRKDRVQIPDVSQNTYCSRCSLNYNTGEYHLLLCNNSMHIRLNIQVQVYAAGN